MDRSGTESESVIADVRFAHENGALAHTLNERPDVDLRLLRETSTDPEPKTYVVQFGSGNSEEFRPVLENDHTVSTIASMPDTTDRTLWGVEFDDDTQLLNPLVTDEGGFVLRATSTTMESGRRGWHEHWLLPHRGAIHTVWEHARETGFEFEIRSFDQWQGGTTDQAVTRTPTEKQLTALTLAYENGYFTEPRETSLEELADLLGLSPSAVSGRLRRGMKLLIEERLLDPEQER